MSHRSRMAWMVILAVLSAWGVAVVSRAQEKKPAIEAKTGISEVTVYPRRALVARTGQVQVPAGEHVVEVRGLPYHLSDRSVGVSAKGTGGLSILGVEVKRYYSGKKRSPEEMTLRKQIDELRLKRRALSDRGRVIYEQLKFLRALRRVTAQRLTKQLLFKIPDAKALGSLMSFVETKAEALLKANRDIYVARRDLSKKLREFYNKLRLIRRGRSTRSKKALIHVRARRKGLMKLKLTYLVPGATWRPIYLVRRLKNSGKLKLTMFGEIRQRTGEDWKGVRLSLSTARPSMGASAPSLSPWYLSYYTPRPKKAYQVRKYDKRRYKQALRKPMAPPQAVAPPPPKPAGTARDEKAAGYVTAAISTGLGSHQFGIKFKVDIPSDGRFHKTTILVKELKSELYYVTVPAISRRVFLRAKAQNDTGATLLPGRVDVFLGPDYVGRSWIKMLAVGQKFELDLGVDPQISVKHRRMEYKRGTSGLFGGSRRMDILWRTEIESFKPKAVMIHVLQRAPVSTEEKIKVDVEPKPEPTKYDKKRGMLRWEIKLTPKKKVVIDLGYSVRYPKDKTVRGI